LNESASGLGPEVDLRFLARFHSIRRRKGKGAWLPKRRSGIADPGAALAGFGGSSMSEPGVGLAGFESTLADTAQPDP